MKKLFRAPLPKSLILWLLKGTMTRQCSALRALVDATQRAYNLSYNRYKNGLDGFLTVLESQRQMVAAQTNYIVAEQNRLSSNVTFVQSTPEAEA